MITSAVAILFAVGYLLATVWLCRGPCAHLLCKKTILQPVFKALFPKETENRKNCHNRACTKWDVLLQNNS